MTSKRIAAVVLNSVSHDARVLKEADSLAAAGYTVAIFGIQDNREAEPTTTRASGVVIHRADWKSASHGLMARASLVAALAAGAATLIIFALAFQWIERTVPLRVALWICGAVLALALMAPFLRGWRRHLNFARGYRNAPATGDEPRVRDHAAILRLPLRLLERARNFAVHLIRQREIVRLLAQFNPDAVHCHDLNAMPIGWAYARRAGARCKVVFDSHELYEEQALSTPSQKRRHRRKQRYYSDKMHGFITINESIAAHLRERYPSLPAPVIVKNATPAPLHEVADDGRLHRAARLPEGTRILLFQGGFALHRGLDVLVRSAPLLPEGWVLVMMGWGKYEPDLRRIAREVDPAGDRVRFIKPAPQAELTAWTAGASLGVIPYENVCLNHWYCTPNKLWEYPVAGVPILASPFPELRKPVEAHNIGRLLADPVTPQNIAQVVAGISPTVLRDMRQACRAYIEADNWGVYERRLVQFYDDLLGVSRDRVGVQPVAARPMIEVAPLVAAASAVTG